MQILPIHFEMGKHVNKRKIQQKQRKRTSQIRYFQQRKPFNRYLYSHQYNRVRIRKMWFACGFILNHANKNYSVHVKTCSYGTKHLLQSRSLHCKAFFSVAISSCAINLLVGKKPPEAQHVFLSTCLKKYEKSSS